MKRNLLIAACFLIAIALGAWYAFRSSTNAPSPESEQAYAAVKDAVLQDLKAPGTADFQSNPILIPVKPDTWEVESWVDAQNSFGAKIRTRIACTVQRSPAGTWEVEGLRLTPW